MPPMVRVIRRFWFEQRLATRMLLIFLPLLLVPLASLGAVGAHGIRQLGDTAIATATRQGTQAAADSTATLQQQGEQALLGVATDQAAINDTAFENVSNMTQILASQTKAIWGSGASGTPPSAFPESQPPPDPQAATVYLFAPNADPTAAAADLAQVSPMSGLLVAFGSSDPGLGYTAWIGTANGVLLSYPWVNTFDPGYDPRLRPWYQAAAGTDQVVWVPLANAATTQLQVVAAQRVTDSSGQVLGVVSVATTVAEAEQLGAAMRGQNGYALVIDQQGNVLISPDLTANGLPSDEELTGQNLLQSDSASVRDVAAQMVAGQSGVTQISLGQGDRYMAFAPLKTTGWSVAVVEPAATVLQLSGHISQIFDDLTQSMQQIVGAALTTTLSVFAVVLGLVVLASIGAALALSRAITRRLQSLDRAALALEEGTLSEEEIDSLAQSEGKDELASLTRLFARMAERVKKREETLRQEVHVLQIEIDHSKAAKDVEAITESEYFRDLQARARVMRAAQGQRDAP